MQPHEHFTSDYIHLRSSQVKTHRTFPASETSLGLSLLKGNKQLSYKAISLCSWLSFTKVTSNANSLIKMLRNAGLSMELVGTASKLLKVSADPGSISLLLPFAEKFSPLLNAEHLTHTNIFCVLVRPEPKDVKQKIAKQKIAKQNKNMHLDSFKNKTKALESCFSSPFNY